MASGSLHAVAENAPPAARSIGSGQAVGWAELLAATLKGWPRPSRLAAPLTKLRGAGPKLAATAANIGIETVGGALLLAATPATRLLLCHRPRLRRRPGLRATVPRSCVR